MYRTCVFPPPFLYLYVFCRLPPIFGCRHCLYLASSLQPPPSFTRGHTSVDLVLLFLHVCCRCCCLCVSPRQRCLLFPPSLLHTKQRLLLLLPLIAHTHTHPHLALIITTRAWLLGSRRKRRDARHISGRVIACRFRAVPSLDFCCCCCCCCYSYCWRYRSRCCYCCCHCCL